MATCSYPEAKTIDHSGGGSSNSQSDKANSRIHVERDRQRHVQAERQIHTTQIDRHTETGRDRETDTWREK